MTFGEKLTQLRKQSKMTQSDLGEKLGVTAQAISKFFFPFRCNKIRKKIQGTLAIDNYEV